MNILVTGSSGLLGANLVLELARAGHQLTALYHHYPIHPPNVRSQCCDLTGDCDLVIREAMPSLIIHCAAATNIEWCEAHPKECMRINGEVPGYLAGLAKSVRAAFVYISTDAVFDGCTGGYSETDPVRPVNQYARTKAAGEAAVLQAMREALVLRVNMFGWNLQPKLSL